MSAPDFLYIGAPRAASTWLYKNLLAHPDVFVPPCKSVLYFHPRFYIYRLKKMKRFWRGAFDARNLKTRTWYRRFFCTPFSSMQWYQSLFPEGQISGEVAEAYCSLNDADIRRVYDMNPKMKIVFVMRNPFDRAVSHAKLGVATRKRKDVGTISEDQFLWHINHPSSEARTFYSQCFEKWEKYFPRDQFFIRFYEEVQDDPKQFLNDLCVFLDVPYESDIFKKTIERRVNETARDDVPLSVRKYAAQKYRGEIEILADRFGGYAKQWLDDVDRLLA